MSELARVMALLKTGCTEQVAVLNGMETELPEPWKSEISNLRKDYDKVLASMPPTEQVPAAGEVNAGINHLSWAVNNMLQVNRSLTDSLKRIQGKVSQEIQSMPGKIEEAITGRVTAGDLVPKAVAAKLVTDAVAALELKHATIARRRTDLVTNGLPMPTAEGVLEGTDEAFGAVKAAATKRLGELRAKGLATDKPEAVDLLYCGAPDYDRQVKLLDLALAVKPGAAKGQTVPDPTRGGGATGAAVAGEKIMVC